MITLRKDRKVTTGKFPELHHRGNTPSVYWTVWRGPEYEGGGSYGGNSYIVVEYQGTFALVSINGIGEERWRTTLSEERMARGYWWSAKDEVEAFDYFFETK